MKLKNRLPRDHLIDRQMFEDITREFMVAATSLARCSHEKRPIHRYLMNIFWLGMNYAHQQTKRTMKLGGKTDFNLAQSLYNSRVEMAATVVGIHRMEDHTQDIKDGIQSKVTELKGLKN